MFSFAYPKLKNIVMKLFKTLSLFVLFSLALIMSCNEESSKQEENINQKLIIFHAGSLSVPFKKIAKAFEKENPNIKIILEADGSRRCARKITDLHKKCDIMASADYSVIDKLLIPEFANWNIKFASNEMTIVYNDKSKYADEINQNNWYNILLKKDVTYGRSDPNSDPCGYRAVLTCKLAEKYYGINGLSSKILTKDVNYMRPKETDLLALLESGNIDYIFLYRSVAQQHGLKYLILPDSVNLKNPELSDYYKTVSIDISGKKPGEEITKVGAPMVYGITIPKNASKTESAIKFLQFLLNKEKGLKILEENGQPSLVPAISETYGKIPKSIKKFALKSNN